MARARSVLGDRWTLLIPRDAFLRIIEDHLLVRSILTTLTDRGGAAF